MVAATEKGRRQKVDDREQIYRSLVNTPAGDVNFKSALERADIDTIARAIASTEQGEGFAGKTKLRALRGRFNRLQKQAQKPSPTSDKRPLLRDHLRDGARVKVLQVQHHQSKDWLGRYGKVERLTDNRAHIRLEEADGPAIFTLALPYDFVELQPDGNEETSATSKRRPKPKFQVNQECTLRRAIRPYNAGDHVTILSRERNQGEYRYEVVADSKKQAIWVYESDLEISECQLRVGDRVQILNCPNAKHVYAFATVSVISRNQGEKRIVLDMRLPDDIEDDPDNRNTFITQESNLAKVEEEDEWAFISLQNSPVDSFEFKCELSGAKPEIVQRALAVIERKPKGNSQRIEKLKKVLTHFNNAAQIKQGDRVRIHSHPSKIFIGEEGDVVEVEECKGKVEFRLDLGAGSTTWVSPGWVEPLPDEVQETAAPIFQVGNRVYSKNSDYFTVAGCDYLYGTIQSIVNKTYWVAFQHPHVKGFYAEELTKCDAFLEGDRVEGYHLNQDNVQVKVTGVVDSLGTTKIIIILDEEYADYPVIYRQRWINGVEKPITAIEKASATILEPTGSLVQNETTIAPETAQALASAGLQVCKPNLAPEDIEEGLREGWLAPYPPTTVPVWKAGDRAIVDLPDYLLHSSWGKYNGQEVELASKVRKNGTASIRVDGTLLGAIKANLLKPISHNNEQPEQNRNRNHQPATAKATHDGRATRSVATPQSRSTDNNVGKLANRTTNRTQKPVLSSGEPLAIWQLEGHVRKWCDNIAATGGDPIAALQQIKVRKTKHRDAALGQSNFAGLKEWFRGGYNDNALQQACNNVLSHLESPSTPTEPTPNPSLVEQKQQILDQISALEKSGPIAQPGTEWKTYRKTKLVGKDKKQKVSYPPDGGFYYTVWNKKAIFETKGGKLVKSLHIGTTDSPAYQDWVQRFERRRQLRELQRKLAQIEKKLTRTH